MPVRYFLLSFFIVLSHLLQAQKKEGQLLVDSLLRQLPLAREDSGKVNLYTSLAAAYDVISAKEGIKYGELGVALAGRLNYKKGLARSYYCLGSLSLLRGDIPGALHRDSVALKIYESIGYKNGIAGCYYNFGVVAQQDDPEQALKILFSALDMFGSGEDDPERKYGIISCNSSIGAAYAIEGNYLQSLVHYNVALGKAKEIGDKKRTAICQSNMGITYYYLGKYPEALNNAFSALKLREEIGARAGVASCYVNIAMIYEAQGSHAEALRYDSAAVEKYKEVGNKHAMAISLQNMGAIYSAGHDTRKSVDCYSIALKLYEEMGDKTGIAYCYQSFGADYVDQAKYPEALSNYFRSLKIFEDIGSKEMAALLYIDIGNAFCRMGKFTEAEKYVRKGLETAAAVGSVQRIKSADESLADIYLRMHDYKRSLEFYKAFIVYRDSLFSGENTKKTVQAQMQYDFDKKESLAKAEQAKKDALLKLKLQRKNILMYGSLSALAALLVIGTLLMRQGKLKASQQRTELEQKQLRAQMNPHFIFNCLNSIQHFIVANDVKNANRYLSGFALLMRQTLENSKEGTITLRREIEYLENYLALETMRFEDKFTWNIVCADNANKDLIEIPSMIIQPFIENAIRHGLTYLEGKQGCLDVNFFVEEGNLFCRVDDNGIGRERSRKIKMAASAVYESHGMELTRRRLALVSRSMGAEYKIEITDRYDTLQQPAGTTVTIKFPIDT